MKNIFTILSIFLISFSCYANNGNKGIKILVGEPLDGIRIAWDYSSIQKIADKGGYPRLLRLKDSSVIAIYEDRAGNIAYKRSYNNGNSWGEPITVFERLLRTNEKGESVLINMANPEIVQLQNGDIVIGCNYRPQQSEIAPFSIAIRRSVDNGATWIDSQVLYDAAPRFNDGCWEPAFLQLPNGELQIYFANENPYQTSDEQEISMLSSQNNGETWTLTPKTVSFRKDRRDGMPVPVVIEDEIVVIIEDNYIDKFKPYTVRTKLNDNWNSTVWSDSPEREYALSERINDSVYMGAPYLITLPEGATLISYQTNESRSSDIGLSTMEVAIGDNAARNFDKRTRPFDVPLNKEANWNALALWDSCTVVALASTNLESAQVAPYMIKGYIIPELIADKDSIINYPIFIGSKGHTNLRAGIADDTENLYIRCRIKEKELYGSNKEQNERVCVYIAPNPSKDEVYKIWSDNADNTICHKNTNNQWIDVTDKMLRTTVSESDGGYELNFEILKRLLGQSDSKEIRLNITLSAYNKIHSQYTEPIVNSSLDEIGSWLKIRLNK